jgi:hypothetical protein
MPTRISPIVSPSPQSAKSPLRVTVEVLATRAVSRPATGPSEPVDGERS